MNIKMLLKVRDRILREKRPVIMQTWFSVSFKDKKNWTLWGGLSGVTSYVSIPVEEIKTLPTKDGIGQFGCGTAGCIAGHAIIEVHGGKKLRRIKSNGIKVWGKNDVTISFSDMAREILDLTSGEADRLFHLYNWPDKYVSLYTEHIRNKKYSQANRVVADRIDYFIETGGL